MRRVSTRLVLVVALAVVAPVAAAGPELSVATPCDSTPIAAGATVTVPVVFRAGTSDAGSPNAVSAADFPVTFAADVFDVTDVRLPAGLASSGNWTLAWERTLGQPRSRAGSGSWWRRNSSPCSDVAGCRDRRAAPGRQGGCAGSLRRGRDPHRLRRLQRTAARTRGRARARHERRGRDQTPVARALRRLRRQRRRPAHRSRRPRLRLNRGPLAAGGSKSR